MRTVRHVLLPLLVAALIAPATAAVAAAPAAAPRAAAVTTHAPAVPTLVGVRAAHHPGYDRVVFDFTGGLPASRTATYVKTLVGDASGLPVRIAGRVILQVRFSMANAHNSAGVSTATGRVAFALPNVLTVVRSGDFEAVTTYGIGLAMRQPFHMFTLRSTGVSHVVVDINTNFPRVMRKVWFFNQSRYLANKEPFFTSVWRPVYSVRPAEGVMDRIFAGPTNPEYASGLRLLRSGAFSWKNLSIVDRVARVQLTGGASSGGSTVTIAGEIMPSLRQFASVDWVKIYDPAGHTEHPYGHSDSIPSSLEP